jgi:hypothetical protein
MKKRKRVVKKLNPKAKQKGHRRTWNPCGKNAPKKLEEQLFAQLENMLRELPKSGTKKFMKKLSALVKFSMENLNAKSACFLISTAFRHPAINRCFHALTTCPEWLEFANMYGNYVLDIDQDGKSYSDHEPEYQERRELFARSQEWR